MELENRVAIITGGARGIGAAIAELFVERGAAVVLADVNKQTVDETAARLKSKGARALGVQVDITDRASVKAMADAAIAEFGKIDILINNAGIANFKNAMEGTDDEWDKVVSVNLTGTQNVCKAVVPYMEKAKYGKIVSISSMAARVGGLKVATDYTASKAGVIGIAKSWARYGASRGILSNAIAPGPTASEMAADNFDVSTMPLGRIGKPLDIAYAALFLASYMSDYITGITLDVNGGQYLP